MTVEYTHILAAASPYAFDLVLRYLSSSPATILERIDLEAATYSRALAVGGHDVLIVVQSVGSVDRPSLVVTVRGEGIAPDVAELAVQRVCGVFGLDVDPAPFEKVAHDEPNLGCLVLKYRGLRPVLIADPYEALMWAVLGQQINLAFARKLKRTLFDLCGRHLHLGDHDYPLTPMPADVAALDPALLAANQFSRQKASYVIGLSQAVASGDLSLETLAHVPTEEAIAVLTSFRGIGRWTAEYVLMRGLGARDIIPAADLGLRSIIGQAYGFGRTATEAEVRAVAARWAGWRSWAAFYWWFTLQQSKVGG